jgi:hypothetical protein
VRFPNALVLAYLGAIIAANLLVSCFGPSIAALNAFLFIGLDLSTRDRLHALWQDRALWPHMLALVAGGGLLSLLLGGASRVALASCLAFVLAGIADTAVYHILRQHSWQWRANGSNLVAAAVDSLCFLLLAFGWPMLWSVILSQLFAKVAGGTFWATLLRHASRHLHAADRP